MCTQVHLHTQTHTERVKKNHTTKIAHLTVFQGKIAMFYFNAFLESDR